jgi:hypothetical protein
MKNSNVKPISKKEMLDKFSIKQYRKQLASYRRTFSMSDTNSGEEYTGTLYWDVDEGFSIYWDGRSPMEYVEFEEFDYTLDAILEESHA